MEDIQQYLKRFKSALVNKRYAWDSHYRELERFVCPGMSSYAEHRHDSHIVKKNTHYDDTAPMALKKYASFINNMLTPQQSRWHSLSSGDEELDRLPEVMQWNSTVTDILFSARYGNKSGFASALQKYFMSIGGFGTGCLYLEDVPGGGIRYRCMNMGAVYVRESSTGFVDGFLIRWDLSLQQIVDNFGEQSLTSYMASRYKVDPEEEISVWNIVAPRAEMPSIENMDERFVYVSVFFEDETNEILATQGYFSKPYISSRINTSPGDAYGRSPASPVMESIKLLNVVKHDMVKQINMATNPPMIAAADAIQQGFAIQPNRILYGGMNNQGTPLIKPLDITGNIQATYPLMEMLQNTVNEAFNLSLFQILNADNPVISATEVLERRNEKYTLLAAELHQISTELFPDLIERELEILSRAELLPELPQALQENGGVYDIKYQSPFARMFGIEETQTIDELVRRAAEYAQFKPEILDKINTDAALQRIADNSNISHGIILDDATVQEIRKQRQIQQNEQQAIEAIPAMAQAEKLSAEADRAQQQAAAV